MWAGTYPSLTLMEALQCVAVCCSVLERVAVCCSLLQSVAVCCSVPHKLPCRLFTDVWCWFEENTCQCVDLTFLFFPFLFLFFSDYNSSDSNWTKLCPQESGCRSVAVCCSLLWCVAVCCSVLQCVEVCCGVLQCIVVYCSVLQCVVVCCNILQCLAVCCSVL